MKPIKTITICLSYLLLSNSNVIAQGSVEQRRKEVQKAELYYNSAEKAYLDGDINAANKFISAALAIDRGHGRTIALSKKIKAGGGDRAVLLLRKRTVRNVLVPVIDIEDLSLREALKVLSNAIEAESDDKITPNFVIQDRHKLMENVKLTMKLKNMPAGNVLDHILSEANGYASYGKYSTEIRSKSTSSGANKKEPVAELIEEEPIEEKKSSE